MITFTGYSVSGVEASFASFSDPVYNDNEAVAFRATFQIGDGVATTANDTCICATAGNASAQALTLVARQGDQAPDCPAGVTFGAFTELALDAAGGATQQGGVVFLATLGGTGVTAADDTGIFAVDATGTLQLIVRTGDIYNGKTITALAFLPSETIVNGQSRSFASSSGDLVYLATFNDKSTAIFNVVFP